MDNKKIALILLLVHMLHEAQSQLTDNLTISILDNSIENSTLKIEFNATSYQRLLGALCSKSTNCYSFGYQRATGHLFYSQCANGNNNLSGNREPNIFGFNYVSNEGNFQRVSQQDVCSGQNDIIGIVKNYNVTQCENKCIYIFSQGSVISGSIEISNTVSNTVADSQCPNVCNTLTQSSSGTQSTSPTAVTTSKDTFSSQRVASTTLSNDVVVTHTNGTTHNTSTALTSKGETEEKTLIIAVTVSVGAILIITIIVVIVCVVLRNRNKSKQQARIEKGVHEKNNTIALDDTYTSTSDYNSIDDKQKGTTITPVNNKGKSVNQYQNSLSPVKTEDTLSTSDATNVNGNHVGDIYAVVNKPNTASHTINTKSQVENTPTSNNVPEGGDDYSYVDKPGSHNSPSREGQVTEYSTLHQVNRMPDDTYTHLGEQLARQNHVTNIGDRDESGSLDRPSDIQIVYLSAKGTGHNDEMKRTSVEI